MNPQDLESTNKPWARPVPEAVPDEEFDRTAEACPGYLHRLAAMQEARMAQSSRPVVWYAGTFWEVRQ